MVKMRRELSKIKTSFRAKILLILLLIALSTVCTISLTMAQSGRAIEVRSEKTLYQPQELVVLYAKVTYNRAPVAAKDVAFQVEGPQNPFINFTFTGSGRTNASGIAAYSFRIPWPDVNPEASVLGRWNVVATVDIAEVVVMNTTTFKVDWMIIITRIQTLNENLQPQTSFLRKKLVVFNLTVENRAATEKIATITINVYDAKNYPIITLILENVTLFPGENVLLASAQIPATASIGPATVYAIPYTALPKFGGIPYSPPASTTFQIITRDIAITEVTLSKTIVKSGETVEIKVKVINKGNETESFYVTVYYNNHVISSKLVSLLPPLTGKEITFEWDTSGVSPGNYIISASAGPVEDEIEIDDNVFIDGIITILPVPISCDVAVTWVHVEPTEVTVGEKVQIEVEVANLGTSPESFNVLIYYDDVLITAQQVSELAPCSERKLIIQWNTTCVREGTYTIKAYIPPLPCEINIENNLYTNGNVTIKAPPPPAKIHDIAIINVHFHPSIAYIGDIIDIWVEAANLGDYPETFNVTVYYNHSEIATQKIWLLQPSQKITLHFTWNTSNMIEGVYTIWAHAEPVPEEISTENNLYIGGNVTLIRRPPPPLICDIAVIWLSANPQTVISGQNITIEVIVANLGDLSEDFNLTIFYNSTLILNMPLTLPAHTNKTVTYLWDTTNVAPGMYRLWANVTILECETNIENNKFEDGIVTVMGVFPLYQLLLLLLPLGIIAGVVAVFLALSYIFVRRRRRKRKKLQKAYGVIVHRHI